MAFQPMTPTDDSKGYAKTSLKMTRSMSEDIGLKIKKILEDIDAGDVDLSYTEWQWFVSQCWYDEIWIISMNKAIQKSKKEKLNLNKNEEFLRIISERTPSELKKGMARHHPLAELSLKDLINKKPPEKTPERKYDDLWLTPKQLKDKYGRGNDGK